jgi:acyl-CoA synthetase (AMP-forming)/AMP-acid ligase II
MPLFHIHGLMAPVLSSLSTGAEVVCTPGFNALKFFSWLDDVAPSWYSAVPTMHQTILARSSRNPDSVANARLRFIRSSSSSLPPQVLHAVEETFGVPVIEAYAMTEASHQMTCNQLPPGERKAGTVGIASGPEVAIMNADGDLLAVGETGEVVIRGPNVTPGYENNPEANAKAFTNGWFRTGDEGVMDEDGFLSLTGRLKEIINRGGEKISPLEVDVALMDHPSIQQVVTFAVPHAKLGEEVAAAVVLREGAEAEPQEIRAFASERLASFKVPKTVLILDEIPKGPTGKPRRIGLAEQLGLV